MRPVGASKGQCTGESVRLSDTRLGRIVDQSVNEIYVFDAETLCFLMVNRGARANLGYTVEEIERMTPLDLKPEFTPSRFEQVLRPLREGEREQVVFQTAHRRKDGTTYDVEVRLQLMQNEAPPVFLAVIEDITDRVRTARALQRANEELELRIRERTAALRDKEERLVSALQASNTGTYRWDIRSDIVECGSQLELLFGLQPDQTSLRIQDFLDLVHPEDRDAVASSLQRCTIEGADFDMMFRIVRPDGSVRWLADQGKMVCDEHGTPIYLIGAYTDVTEHERTREALGRSEAKFRLLAENIRDVLWIGSADWRQVTYVNQAYEELWGRSCHSLYANGMSWLEGIHPDDRARVDEEIRCKAASSPDFDPYFSDYRVMRGDGSSRWVSARVYPVSDERRNVQLIVGIAEDVTARKLAEERVEETLQRTQSELSRVARVTTLGELVASIAHEVNQPLAAVVTNGQASLRWLEFEMPRLDEARGAIERAINAGVRASEVISRLRRLSERGDTQKVALDINAVINEVLHLVQHEALDQKVSLQFYGGLQLPAVLGNRVQLQQVVINMIINAFEAMTAMTGDESRKVQISTLLNQEDHVVVAVQDAGCGISPEDADHLFEPFFTTKAHGTGMGLSISRSIIQAHGGRIWACLNPDRGTTVQFGLPAHR